MAIWHGGSPRPPTLESPCSHGRRRTSLASTNSLAEDVAGDQHRRVACSPMRMTEGHGHRWPSPSVDLLKSQSTASPETSPAIIAHMASYGTTCIVKVATGQIASTGVVSLSYVQKVSEKVSLATDFMYNHLSKDVTASVGYDYNLRQCRLRGKVDTNGVVTALLEERLGGPLNLVLSAELDHWKKDYKFGFGMTIG